MGFNSINSSALVFAKLWARWSLASSAMAAKMSGGAVGAPRRGRIGPSDGPAAAGNRGTAGFGRGRQWLAAFAKPTWNAPEHFACPLPGI